MIQFVLMVIAFGVLCFGVIFIFKNLLWLVPALIVLALIGLGLSYLWEYRSSVLTIGAYILGPVCLALFIGLIINQIRRYSSSPYFLALFDNIYRIYLSYKLSKLSNTPFSLTQNSHLASRHYFCIVFLFILPLFLLPLSFKEGGFIAGLLGVICSLLCPCLLYAFLEHLSDYWLSKNSKDRAYSYFFLALFSSALSFLFFYIFKGFVEAALVATGVGVVLYSIGIFDVFRR